jgi:hypothetical protein
LEKKVAIIGSGLSAIAVHMALKSFNINVTVFSGMGGHGVKYCTNNPASVQVYGGLGNDWHGVIPFGRASTVSSAGKHQLLRHWYPDLLNDNFYFEKDFIFVPKKPIRPKKYWQGESSVVVIKGNILSIKKNDNLLQLDCDDGNLYEFNDCYIATGFFEFLKIIAHSNLVSNSASYKGYDHINGTLGYVRYKDILRLGLDKIAYLKSGYLKKYLLLSYRETDQILITFRPAAFDFRPNFKKNKISSDLFSNKKYLILKNILLKPSLGKIIEALHNRFGLKINCEYYSVHYQILTPVKEDSNVLTHVFDRHDFEKIKCIFEIKSNLTLENPLEFNYYPGTHLQVDFDKATVNCLKDSNVHVVGNSVYGSRLAGHHSFNSMAQTFDYVNSTAR